MVQRGASDWAGILKADKKEGRAFHEQCPGGEGEGEPEWRPTRTYVELKDQWRSMQLREQRIRQGAAPGRRAPVQASWQGAAGMRCFGPGARREHHCFSPALPDACASFFAA